MRLGMFSLTAARNSRSICTDATQPEIPVATAIPVAIRMASAFVLARLARSFDAWDTRA
jgi:hypothetical protein